MHVLTWTQDNPTATAAQQFPLPLRATAPAAQFAGFNFSPRSWDRRVLTRNGWPVGPLVSSPQEIISLFAAGKCLEGLAMVVSWGRMWRQPNTVYGARHLEAIDAALRASAASIQQTNSVAGAWALLTSHGTDQLGWSAVLTSKTLHFLCRALGFTKNPPVAIDGLVIRDTVWPAWRRIVPPTVLPRDWKGDSLEAYLRYMTAILVWAERRGWTTPQLEATIFAEYRS
jgi:8-oxoguanine DNA glycosylase-like protein